MFEVLWFMDLFYLSYVMFWYGIPNPTAIGVLHIYTNKCKNDIHSLKK